MFAAKKKRNENIIEYLLYMYQIEDIIRACELDFEKLNNLVISKYEVNKNDLEEIRFWYKGLVLQMKEEDLRETGHLQSIKNLIAEMNELHLWLIKTQYSPGYKEEHEHIQPLLIEYQYRAKTNFSNEVEIALNAVYSYVMLKINNNKVGKETLEAVIKISSFLNQLARHYKEYGSGNLKE